MHHSNSVNFVQNIARAQLHYEAIFSAQSKVLRLDPAGLKAAMARFQSLPLLAKPGQTWEPLQGDVETYLAKCDEICKLKPGSFDELSV